MGQKFQDYKVQTKEVAVLPIALALEAKGLISSAKVTSFLKEERGYDLLFRCECSEDTLVNAVRDWLIKNGQIANASLRYVNNQPVSLGKAAVVWESKAGQSGRTAVEDVASAYQSADRARRLQTYGDAECKVELVE